MRPKPLAGKRRLPLKQQRRQRQNRSLLPFPGQHPEARMIGLHFFPGLFELTILPHSAQAQDATRGKARIIDGDTIEVDGT